MRTVAGREAVLRLAGQAAYARFATSMADGIVGLSMTGAVLWQGDTRFGRIAHGLGPGPAIVELVTYARHAGWLDAGWINLPRGVEPPGLDCREVWDFRWSTAPPPPVPGRADVVPVADGAAVDELLDAAMPDAAVRFGHPMARRWFGIWRDGRLAACATDRSTRCVDPTAPVVGVIGSVAVHPSYRRQGLGAAVTAALTERLRAAHGLVTLGVMADNDDATRVYQRLGYTAVAQITSWYVRPPDSPY
jgi:GNAT superfamily N-acetyltransferase